MDYDETYTNVFVYQINYNIATDIGMSNAHTYPRQ
jgi:hypothetical protein